MLYACGSNGSGQLGLGHQHDVEKWTEVPIAVSGPIRLVGGGNHTVLLEESTGHAWITENNKFTQIFHPRGHHWKLASAGFSFVVLVDSEDRLFVHGHGHLGELGLGDIGSVDEVTEMPWIPPDEVLAIDSGLRHTVVCTAKGELFGWGASRKAQCGCEAKMMREPTKFAGDPKATQIACGRDFTLVINVSGELRVYGDHDRFADIDSAKVEKPKVLAAGWSNFLVQNQDGSLRLYGPVDHNQIELPQRAKTIAVGSEHILWVDDQNYVHTSGWREHGNCPLPQQFSGRIQVFGGCATSFVYTY